MTFWCGSESGSIFRDMDLRILIRILLFSSLTLKTPTKNKFFKEVSAFYFLKVSLHHFFKDKKSKRSHRTVGIKVFSYFFCLMIEGSGSGSGFIPVPNGSGSGSRRPMQKHTDPTDPDPDSAPPQHCLWLIMIG
jgi:hypothetical protein